MGRKLQSSYTRARSHVIAAFGHSLCSNLANGVRQDKFWPEQLAALLRADGYGVRARNFGRAGNVSGPFAGLALAVVTAPGTTSFSVSSIAGINLYDLVYLNGQVSYVNGLGGSTITLGNPILGIAPGQTAYIYTSPNADTIFRLPQLTLFEVPDIAILWIGENDPANLWDSSTAPTKNTNITDVLVAGSTRSSLIVNGASASKFLAKGAVIVGSGASIQSAIVQSIAGTGPYTLTLANPLGSAPNTGDPIAQGTQPNIQFLVQSLINAGVTRILVCSTHHLNFDPSDASSDYAGAGTLNPYVPYQNLRTYMQGAAAATYVAGPNGAATVLYCDLYNALIAIAAGTASNTSGGSTGTNPFGATNKVPYNGSTYVFGAGVDCSPSWDLASFAWHITWGNITAATIGGTITGYTNGTVMTFTGGSGRNAQATLTVAAGNVTAVSWVGGVGYKSGDVLTASSGGLTLTVTAVSNNIHLNELGNYLIARIIRDKIKAQSTWLTDLAA